MSVLSSVKPQPWPLSPALTEAPELWRGHSLVYPAWMVGAPSLNGLMGQPNLNLIGGASCAIRRRGAAAVFGGGGSGQWAQAEPVTNPRFPTGKSGEGIVLHTLFFNDVINPSDLTTDTIFGIRPSSGDGGDGFWIRLEYFDFNPGNTWQPYFRTFGSNNENELSTSSVVSGGVLHSVSVGWDVGSGYDVYVDGELATQTANADAGSASSSYSVEMGGGSDGTAGALKEPPGIFEGAIYMVSLRSVPSGAARNIVASESAIFNRDPFAMIRPRSDL